MADKWIYGTNWFRALTFGTWDAVAITADMFVGSMKDKNYVRNYVPESFKETNKFMAQPTAHLTPEQLEESKIKGDELVAEGWERAAGVQDGMVLLATLPVGGIGGGVLKVGGGAAVKAVTTTAVKEVAKTGFKATAKRMAINGGRFLAYDLAAQESTHLIANNVLPGTRPSDSLGTALVARPLGWVNDPNSTEIAKEELARAKGMRAAGKIAVEEANNAEKKLYKNGIAPRTVEELLEVLDVNKNGRLDDAAKAKITEIMNNDAAANRLFADLENRGIVFGPNQTVNGILTSMQNQMATEENTPGTTNYPAGSIGNPGNNEPGLIEKIGKLFESIGDTVLGNITDMFRYFQHEPSDKEAYSGLPPVGAGVQPSMPSVPFAAQEMQALRR